MQAVVASQQAEMQRLQAEQVKAYGNQQQQVAVLQGQEQQQLATIQQMRDATSTVGTSLRILASQPQNQAPTAQQTRSQSTAGARTTSPTASLRIGSSGRGSGVGVNLGG